MGYFDPLGLSAGKSDEVMNLYRAAELKHGRVAMAACLGWYITAAGVHPAFDSKLSSDPLEAMKELPTVGWIQFVLGCGAIEWLTQQIRQNELTVSIIFKTSWIVFDIVDAIRLSE